MGLKFEKYKEAHLESCARLIRSTWNFHKAFEGIKDESLIYIHYLLTCLNYSEHLDVLVDDNQEVKGILFGSIEDETWTMARKYRKAEKALNKWTQQHIQNGDFGNPKEARRILKAMAENDEKGETCASKFDSEVNLFIVSPDLRGQGYGRKLMDRYVAFCKKNQLKTAFLWTDEGCSYSFYEKYGFTFYKGFSLSTSETKDSGMIYVLDIDEVSS